MNTITAWVLSILGIVILGTVIDLFISKSRLKNYIRSIFATVSILIILTPLPAIIQNGFDFDWDSLQGGIVTDEGYLDYTNKMKIKIMENALIKAYTDEGFKNLSVKIDGVFEGGELTVKSVTFNLKNLVIDPNLEHINKYEFIREKMKKYLSIETEVSVIFNE